MTRRVEWTARALQDAARLAATDRERVLAAVERLATSEQGDVRKLQVYRDE